MGSTSCAPYLVSEKKEKKNFAIVSISIDAVGFVEDDPVESAHAGDCGKVSVKAGDDQLQRQIEIIFLISYHPNFSTLTGK